MQAVYAFVVALFVSTTLIPPLGRVAHALRLTDKPGGRKAHAGLIPRTGGIAIFVGALLPAAALAPAAG